MTKQFVCGILVVLLVKVEIPGGKQMPQKHRVYSGDRTGSAVLWDLQGGSVAQKFSNHGGHVTSCTIYSDDSMSAAPLYLTGAQDGYVRVWDTGAVSSIMSSGNVVVTAGADKKIRVLDPRAGFIPRASFGHHRSFIYSLKCIG
eukprot:GSMAST32.ASY1.ANO1.1649.1 assembled CDS